MSGNKFDAMDVFRRACRVAYIGTGDQAERDQCDAAFAALAELIEAARGNVPPGDPEWHAPTPGAKEVATLRVRRDQWERFIAALEAVGGDA